MRSMISAYPFRFRLLASRLCTSLCACAISVCLSTCGLFEPQPVDIRAGLYEGDYTVTTTTSSGVTANVWRAQMNFSNGVNFKVQSLSIDSLPLTGNGTYTLKYRLVTLTDRVTRASTTNTTHLINGDYVYTFDGMNLVMTQEQGSVKKQLFLLKR